MKVLGVAVSSGVVYYGALSAPGGGQDPAAITEAPERLVPAVGLTGAERLADAYQRIAQDIRVLSPATVVLVGTRRHSNWKYKEASERISLISALMLACAHEDVAYEEWTTERIGKIVGVPAQSLASFPYEELGLGQRPKYWGQGRGSAYAAAMAQAAGDRS
ncbi:hypothetical protein [Streptomyces malaysiensis]|uniref:hypothetical protein n=1 Tax=Streptomyces malaysiensis TaxID=92644 RepID=UPI0036A14A79